MNARDERFDAWKERPGRSTLVSLLEASQGRILSICHDVLHDRHEAEEAAQEALFKIISGLERVSDSAHYDHWSARVAMRTALDRKRSLRRRRKRELQAALHRPGGSSPCDELHDAIGQLPEDDRALILERYFDSRTFGEMGKSRGLSDVAVRKRMVKARERLKRMLGCAILVPFWMGGVVFGATAMKSKGAIAVALLLIVVVLGWFAFNRRGGLPSSTSQRASSSSNSEVADRGPTKAVLASTPPEAPDASPAKLSWKGAAPQYVYMSSPLIPVPGKNRMPFMNTAMILRDHFMRWGMDPDEYKRIRPVIEAVRRVDEEILRAWGGKIRPGGPHEPREISDLGGLSAFLIKVADGTRSDVSPAVEASVEDKHAFDDMSVAVKQRALAMLGSFPGDPEVLEHQRRLFQSADAPEVRGLAASNLVKLGHEAEALAVFRSGTDTAALRVFLSALSLGTWEGETDSDLSVDGYPLQGAESRHPSFLQGLVATMSARPDRESFLLAAKVLALTPTEPIARNAVLSLWEEARRDPGLAEKLMENKYQWKRTPEVLPILIELAVGENPRMALLAASQLYVHNDAASIMTLVRLMSHEDPRKVWVAVGAISGGGAAHPDLAIPALQAVIASNRDPDVVERAKYSLQKIRQHLDKRTK